MIVVALVAVLLTLPLAAIRAPEGAMVKTVSVVEPAAPALNVAAFVPRSPAPVGRKPAPETSLAPTEPAIAELPKAEIPTSLNSPINLPPDLRASAGTSLRGALVQGVRPDVPPPFECHVTPSVMEIKMKATKSPLGSGPWRFNEDQTIWTWDTPYIAGSAVNTMWMKPANADLVITGRRLDGESAPLKAQAAKDSTATYIATSLNFPKAGCCEVTAAAGPSTLTFITRVDAQ